MIPLRCGVRALCCDIHSRPSAGGNGNYVRFQDDLRSASGIGIPMIHTRTVIHCLTSPVLWGWLWLVFAMTVNPLHAVAIEIVGLLAGAGGLGDQSYNDMTMTGLGKAQNEYHFKLIVQETQGTQESQEEGLKRLLEQNAEVIVTNGAGLGNLITTYSVRYPHKYFLVNDFAAEGYDNVASTLFAHEEGSYLAGLLAASVSTSGSIGFIGGVDMPVIHRFLDGFTQGANSVSEKVIITSAFISPKGDYSGFTDPSRGFQVATTMYQDGVDIIFAVAGLTGNGVIQAASVQKKLVIGVDADQDHMAKGYVLTSMMKRLDQSTYLEMIKIMNNTFKPGVTHYGLENGGVSLSPMLFTRHLIDDETIKHIHQAEQDIINGKIRIHSNM